MLYIHTPFNSHQCYVIFVTDSVVKSNTSLSLSDTMQMKIFLVAVQPNVGHGFLIHEVSRSHMMKHHSQ